ncbi:hypothetical protein CFP56_042504 [Quercus suber]|uniref:Uncharacterized protein n=1 Tax=Quercus suber TaxID=58331 RepID=A0AAW0LK64_QUESU
MAKSQPDYCLFQLPLPESHQEQLQQVHVANSQSPKSRTTGQSNSKAQPHLIESVLDYPVRGEKRGQVGRGVSRDALSTYAAGTIWTWR